MSSSSDLQAQTRIRNAQAAAMRLFGRGHTINCAVSPAGGLLRNGTMRFTEILAFAPFLLRKVAGSIFVSLEQSALTLYEGLSITDSVQTWLYVVVFDDDIDCPNAGTLAGHTNPLPSVGIAKQEISTDPPDTHFCPASSRSISRASLSASIISASQGGRSQASSFHTSRMATGMGRSMVDVMDTVPSR